MRIPQGFTLESLHERIGGMLKLGNRLFAAVLLLGSLFSVVAVKSQIVLQHPAEALHLQAFQFNYSEFRQVEGGLSSRQIKTLARLWHKVNDPDWDGALAGLGAGLSIGQDIPMVGLILAPAIGAAIGYQLDSEI